MKIEIQNINLLANCCYIEDGTPVFAYEFGKSVK